MKYLFSHRRIRRSGFTLIEITLAAALAVVVGGVVFATFSSGLRLWKRHQEGFSGRDTAFLFERMQRDFENGASFGEWVLRGNATQCEFPSWAAFVTKPEGRVPAPGRVSYLWDEATSQALRSVTSLSDDYQGIQRDGRAVLSGVESFSFAYCLPGPQGACIWLDQWPPEEAGFKEGEGGWPLAVRFGVSVRNDKKTYEAVKIFSLPLGG